MKSLSKFVIFSFLVTSLTAFLANAERVVILHTNDTHSQIDPTDNDFGGIVRRKAAIDSVRRSEPNVLLVDAGDAVQGTLYFTLFSGEVEQKLLNEMAYDVQIVGNHEFDNGLESLKKAYLQASPTIVSSNYDFSDTPLQGIFKDYVVKQVGNKRIGFLGININPDGLINPRNIEGVKYIDPLEAANKTADYLKNKLMVDAVVAVTHIGYRRDENSTQLIDPELAQWSRNIDIIIGGHSHTDLRPYSPMTKMPNLDGDTVLIVQNKKAGQDLGEVILDFSDNGIFKDWKKISIDTRHDANTDPELTTIIEPYRAKVDSIANEPLVAIHGEFTNRSMLNFATDFVYREGSRLNKNKKVDLSIVNKGGIRRNFIGPTLTVGQVISAFPFDNRIVVVDIKGSDLREIFNIMARHQGNGIGGAAEAMMSDDYTSCEWININGKPIDDNAVYRVATIDYVAGGGDNMWPFKKSRLVAESDKILYNDMLDYFRAQHHSLKANDEIRMHHSSNLE